MSKPSRAARIALVALALLGLGGITARFENPAPRPARFPAGLLPTGEVPAVWVFVRAECPACRRHVRALEVALHDRDAGARARLERRIHVVGDVPCAAITNQHARAWLQPFGATTTPLTWWVAADSTIARAWRGPRDAACWQRALDFALQEAR